LSFNILETEWWSLAVPPEWWAESEDESILVGDHDGVGCIEISTLFKDSGEFDEATVLQIARDEADTPVAWQSVRTGDFSGVTGNYLAEGAAIREWYVMRGAMLLYITYSCDEDNGGMDDAAVDEILETLTASRDD
jgi:hypothetical protein